MACALSSLAAAGALAGCMSMDGPCVAHVVVKDGQADRIVQCEAGGALWLLAPAPTIEAAGQVGPACWCERSDRP